MRVELLSLPIRVPTRLLPPGARRRCSGQLQIGLRPRPMFAAALEVDSTLFRVPALLSCATLLLVVSACGAPGGSDDGGQDADGTGVDGGIDGEFDSGQDAGLNCPAVSGPDEAAECLCVGAAEYAARCDPSRAAIDCVNGAPAMFRYYWLGGCRQAVVDEYIQCRYSLECGQLETLEAWERACQPGEVAPFCEQERQLASDYCPFERPCTPAPRFMCASGDEITGDWVCDSDLPSSDGCADGSDELQCNCHSGPYCRTD